MSKRIAQRAVGIVLACVMAWVLPGCGDRSDTLKIGVIGPLTGGGAPWGQAAVEAGRILAEEVNAAGGLQVGSEHYDIQFINYDDKYNTTEAVAAYNRLVHQDGVQYMLVLTGTSTAALKQNIEADGVVALSGSYTGNRGLDENTKYVFRFYSDPDQYGIPYIQWIENNIDGRRVVTINPNDETGWHVADVSARALGDAGFQVLHQELYERTLRDFQPMLTRIISMNPDIIDLGSTPPATGGLVVRQMRELGYDGSIIKMGGPGPRDIIASAGATAAEGMVTVLYADPSNPGYQRLAEEYRRARGHEPNEIIVTYYDAMRVLLRAIQEAGTVDDAEAVAAAFARALPMESVQGDEIRLGGMEYYGSNTQFLTTNYIGVIRSGEPVAVDRLQSW